MTIKANPPFARSRAFRIAGALVGVAVVLGACKPPEEVSPTVAAPDDYRLRHPIAVQEADQSIVVFVGRARSGLSASQRADVLGLAQTWLREATGAIYVDVPVGTANARDAANASREIRATLASAGVPARGIVVRHYHPEDPHQLPPIRLNYPRLPAIDSPCRP